MFEQLKIVAAHTLANKGLPNVEFGYKLEQAGDGSQWINWLDNTSPRLGQVSFTADGQLIQVTYLG